MKYFSDKLNRVYETVEELETAEAELDRKNQEKKKLVEERAARAKEVEEAYKAYRELLSKFCDDYGSFHTSFTSKDFKNGSLIDALFDLF